MATGTVRIFDQARGFGFIETDARDEDVFFHVHDLEGPPPVEGQTLEFTIVDDADGPRVGRIRRPARRIQAPL